MTLLWTGIVYLPDKPTIRSQMTPGFVDFRVPAPGSMMVLLAFALVHDDAESGELSGRGAFGVDESCIWDIYCVGD